MKNFPPPYPAIIGSLSLAALSLAFSAPAEAIIVNVNGTDYEVTTFNGNYNDNESRFLTEMPWWGDVDLAINFALALYPKSPAPNGGLPGNSPGDGPYFAYSIIPGTAVFVSATSINDGSPLNKFVFLDGFQNYAIATPIPVPLENNALPIFGATLFMFGGLWWKKKRGQEKANLDFSSPEQEKLASILNEDRV